MEATDRSNGTPLAYAAKGQHTEICKLLLENGWSLEEELKQRVFAELCCSAYQCIIQGADIEAVDCGAGRPNC